uniref:RRM domain-containing protein n=1 Tax=Angiostrongylus cantonensis TaxID=6313 RepID=A0A0K0DPU7_ANGCA
MNQARFPLDLLLWPSDPHFNMGDDEDRMCYVGNFTSLVTADLLEELFTQVGPVEKVTLTDRNSYRFAMVTFEDEESVPFAVRTLDGIGLFDTPLRVKPRNGSKHGARIFRESYGRRWHTHLPPMSSSAVLSTLTPPALPPPHISPLKSFTLLILLFRLGLKHNRLPHLVVMQAALGHGFGEEVVVWTDELSLRSRQRAGNLKTN